MINGDRILERDPGYEEILKARRGAEGHISMTAFCSFPYEFCGPTNIQENFVPLAASTFSYTFSPQFIKIFNWSSF